MSLRGTVLLRRSIAWVINGCLLGRIARCRRSRCRRRHLPCTCQAHSMVCTARTPNLSQTTRLIVYCLPHQLKIMSCFHTTFTKTKQCAYTSISHGQALCVSCGNAAVTGWPVKALGAAADGALQQTRARSVRICAHETGTAAHEMRRSLPLCIRCPHIRRACKPIFAIWR
jgi:hypothetical protein